MKIILTGEKNIGKSTAIDRVLNRLDYNLAGFRSVLAPNKTAPERVLKITDPRGFHVCEVAQYMQNRLAYIDTDSFDTDVAALLDPSEGTQLIIMDELGFMENNSQSQAHP